MTNPHKLFEEINDLFKQASEKKITKFDFEVYDFFNMNLKSFKNITFNPQGFNIDECILKFDKEKKDLLKKYKIKKFDKNTWQKSRLKLENIIISEIDNNFYSNLYYLYSNGIIHTLRDRMMAFEEQDEKLKKDNVQKIASDLLNDNIFDHDDDQKDSEISLEKKKQSFEYFKSLEGKSNIPIPDSKKFQKKIDELSKLITASIRGYLNIQSTENKGTVNRILREIKDDLESL